MTSEPEQNAAANRTSARMPSAIVPYSIHPPGTEYRPGFDQEAHHEAGGQSTVGKRIGNTLEGDHREIGAHHEHEHQRNGDGRHEPRGSVT